MTTTACDDQFTVGTQTIERVRQPYDTVAILRRNVADLELALRTQTSRAEAAEAELAKLREQEPVAWRHENGNLFLSWQKDLITTGAVFSPLYAAPVPAPAVLEKWRDVMQDAHDTFQRYADQHRAKDTRDSHEKANVNQKLANRLYALLQSAEGSNAAADRLLEGGE